MGQLLSANGMPEDWSKYGNTWFPFFWTDKKFYAGFFKEFKKLIFLKKLIWEGTLNPLESISGKKFTFSTMPQSYNLSFKTISVHKDYSSLQADGLPLIWGAIKKGRNAELEHLEFYKVISVFPGF